MPQASTITLPPSTSLMAALRSALLMLLLLTLITGVIYPLTIAGIAQLFPHQAQGSLINADGKVVGSELIGQSFTTPNYFWGRPSATATTPYNALASGGSNLGPLNPALLDQVKTRIAALHAADPHNTAPIPVDLVTASASGLDPHISIAAAQYQIDRVARARGLDRHAVEQLVQALSSPRGVFGWAQQPLVNVLQLNMALDSLQR